VFGWYRELDMKEKGATAAYVIALLWNLSVWIGKNTEDIAYDMW
jgi:hypothetical protein